jgi:hypothetical protein
MTFVGIDDSLNAHEDHRSQNLLALADQMPARGLEQTF